MQHLMGNKLKKTFLSAGKTVKDLERCLCKFREETALMGYLFPCRISVFISYPMSNYHINSQIASSCVINWLTVQIKKLHLCYQNLKHGTVFFSHNKSAAETISRTDLWSHLFNSSVACDHPKPLIFKFFLLQRWVDDQENLLITPSPIALANFRKHWNG